MAQAQESFEDALYTIVLEEVEAGMVIRDLWAKSLVHCDFDLNKTRASYIRERVSRLKKSKSLCEYVRLVAKEAEFDAANMHAQMRYERALSLHQEQIQNLESVRQKIEDQIADEVVELKRRKEEAAADFLEERKKATENSKRDKNRLLFVGLALSAIAGGLYVLEIQLMVIVFFGLLAALVLGSAFISPASPESCIESINLSLDSESPLARLRKQHQGIKEQIESLKGNPPQKKQPTNNGGPQRSRITELEKELYPLFALDAV